MHDRTETCASCAPHADNGDNSPRLPSDGHTQEVSERGRRAYPSLGHPWMPSLTWVIGPIKIQVPALLGLG